MPISTQQEQGNLYPAESPSFHKGETGKGANVKMGKQPDLGQDMPMGKDKYASDLKKTWGQAMKAGSRFGNF